MELIQYTQETRRSEIPSKIIELENTAWPNDENNQEFPSSPDTYVSSFVLLENNLAICHVGIRNCILHHRGVEYLAYGLSEVVTHPDYQNNGFASQLIKNALQYIISLQADISIFTCAKERTAFYARGGWEIMPTTCFVGGTRQNPFRSDALNLVTMAKFISPKCKQHRADFENTDIVFELGENQLW